jgi:hypothetical protein
MAARRKSGILYPSELEKTLFKWDTYVPLVTKGLNKTLFSDTSKCGKLKISV